MSYAENTSVPVERSQAEIRKTLTKYGASGFAFGEASGYGVVQFEMKMRRIRFSIPLPTAGVTVSSKNKYRKLTIDEAAKITRSKWRCLLLAIKARLECVESGIESFEEAFLAHVVLPSGQTLGAVAIPQIETSYKDGKMPPLLGYSQ